MLAPISDLDPTHTRLRESIFFTAGSKTWKWKATLLPQQTYLQAAVNLSGLQIPDINCVIKASTYEMGRTRIQTHTCLFCLMEKEEKSKLKIIRGFIQIYFKHIDVCFNFHQPKESH